MSSSMEILEHGERFATTRWDGAGIRVWVVTADGTPTVIATNGGED